MFPAVQTASFEKLRILPVTLFQDIKQILPRYNRRVVPTFTKYICELQVVGVLPAFLNTF
jgi:hypothetical protein